MGTVRLMVKKHNAVMIPQVAVFEEQDRKYVFVVDKQNRVHQRAVTIGAEFSGGLRGEQWALGRRTLFGGWPPKTE